MSEDTRLNDIAVIFLAIRESDEVTHRRWIELMKGKIWDDMAASKWKDSLRLIRCGLAVGPFSFVLVLEAKSLQDIEAFLIDYLRDSDKVKDIRDTQTFICRKLPPEMPAGMKF